MPRSSNLPAISAAAGVLSLLAACAAPITQLGTVAPEDVRAEQREQLRLAAQTVAANQQRLERISAPLLRAAAPLCRSTAKTDASPPRASSNLADPLDAPCPFRVVVLRDDDLNAAADGSNIYVATAMMRFASDEELSVVIAHEIAHNAMRHRDAQMKNALGGAMLGAVADVAVAALSRGRASTNVMQAGAEAGAQAFSQDFEREADYVGLYILAWAAAPTGNAADFWRRMAVEKPAGILFATTHPTTAERFVRLEQWSREIERKIVSGAEFGPEMRDRRLSVVNRPRGAIAVHESGGEVVESVAPTSVAPALGTDAGRASVLAPLRVVTTVRVPRSEADRLAAASIYERGWVALGAQRWGQAKADFLEALRLDPSVAAYHAGLGEVLIVEKNWVAATDEYRTALRLDPGNPDYRLRLKDARMPRPN